MSEDVIAKALAKASARRELTERIKKMLIENLSLQLKPEEIAEDSPLFGSGLGLDSIDALEIVVALEQEFGISIMDEDLQAFRSINTIIDFVEEKRVVAELEEGR